MATVPTGSIRFVPELYPRLKPSDEVIARYRAAKSLPPIVVARDGILVDGYHRWQAHIRDGIESIEVQNLGDLADLEIRKESIRRNSQHGHQLNEGDKKKQAGELYLLGMGEEDLADLLSLKPSTLAKYLEKAKQEERERRQAQVWDLWLDCLNQTEIARIVGIKQNTVSDWLSKVESDSDFDKPPSWTERKPRGNLQDGDVWRFPDNPDNPDYFGAMPPQVVENLLWLYTEPGQIVVDPFAGSGTTIRVAKQMGRRVWASDLSSPKLYPDLPIHEHDIVIGWPADAPKKANFILLDPPYWIQAKQRYSASPNDLGNMSLDEFYSSWATTLKHTSEHLADDGYIAFITSPAEVKEQDIVVDLAHGMYRIAEDEGLRPHRRIIVTYTTQQASGQQIEWARRERKLLKLYRDLVVLKS